MPDLKDQIRTYFDEIDPPFNPAELMREPHRTQHPRRIMTARAFTLAAGAAALVLMLIGGPILLLRGTSDVENQPSSLVDVVATVATTPPTMMESPLASTPKQPPEATPTDSVPERVLNSAWNQLAAGQEVFGETLLYGVAAFGDLLVAYGEVATGEQEYEDGSGTYTVGTPVAWAYDGAGLWSPIAASGAVPRDNIVAGGPGMVSISIADGAPMSWLSTDGVTWAEVPLDREVFADWEDCGENNLPNFDELWSAGPVIIAHHKYLCGPAHYPGRVWVTTDGYEWSSLQPAAFGEEWPNGWDTTLGGGDDPDNWRLNDVAGVDGAIVAVGEDLGPAVWFSTDGYVWQKNEIEIGDFVGHDVKIWKVATNGTGFVAMGTTGGEFTRDVLVWTSSDGRDWSQAPIALGTSLGEARELAAFNGGYIALGWSGALLTSPDGVTWQSQTTGSPMSYVSVSGIGLTESRLYVTGLPTATDKDGTGRIGQWEPLLFYWEPEAL
jgi:hypothetical protein